MYKTIAAIALLVAACGPASTPVAHLTSSPSAPATASPAPELGVCDPTHRCLALVTLRGSNYAVVRDVTDLDHPTTIATLGPVAPQFVTASTVSYVAPDGGIVTAPLSGSPVKPVAGAANDGASPAWSPDGTSLVYTTARGSVQTGDEHLDVHLLRAGTDRIVGSTPGMGVGGCEFIGSCTLPNWLDSRLMFSPDGKFFSFVAQTFGASFFYVWSSDGTLAKGDAAHTTTMSTWSSQSLYYSGATGVESWRSGTSSTLLARVAWIKPSASPAGGQIVYTVRDASGWGHIDLVDTATGQTRELKAERTNAVFLTSRYVWYRGERACLPSDNCGPNPPFHPESLKTYIYDLQTGTEYESVITNVFDVWPHAA